MAYRRKQQLGRPLASVAGDYDYEASSTASSSSSLAAKAIRASSAHMESSLSSAYATTPPLHSPSQEFRSSSHGPVKYSAEAKRGFWGALGRKAKSNVEDNNMPHPQGSPEEANAQMLEKDSRRKVHQSHQSPRTSESPALQKGLGAIASSLSYIGGSIGTAVGEGLTIVEKRAAEIIHETRENIKKKSNRFQEHEPAYSHHQPVQQSQTEAEMQTEQEIQLKASRDDKVLERCAALTQACLKSLNSNNVMTVEPQELLEMKLEIDRNSGVAMAMAAKAKLLLRELKTVKADLAFAKERCAQLEEENKILRENHGRDDSPEDDDLIRLQLETLLAEKARLAHENSVYARENRFLREVVEYHQLTMQDVVYLDESSEEVSEVYPTRKVPLLLNRHSSAALSAAMPPSASICPVPPPGAREDQSTDFRVLR